MLQLNIYFIQSLFPQIVILPTSLVTYLGTLLIASLVTSLVTCLSTLLVTSLATYLATPLVTCIVNSPCPWATSSSVLALG